MSLTKIKVVSFRPLGWFQKEGMVPFPNIILVPNKLDKHLVERAIFLIFAESTSWEELDERIQLLTIHELFHVKDLPVLGYLRYLKRATYNMFFNRSKWVDRNTSLFESITKLMLPKDVNLWFNTFDYEKDDDQFIYKFVNWCKENNIKVPLRYLKYYGK